MSRVVQRSPFERALRVTLGVALAFGCAREVNTLEPLDETDIINSSGGTASKGGSSSASAGSLGKPSAGGSAINAFGGSASSGGKAGAASSMGGGGAQGGRAGAGGGSGTNQGGNSQGGTSQAGTSQGGSSAGTAGRGGSGGSGGATGSGCLMSWRDNDACDTCTTQTQSDKKACAQVLDCYLQNDCGPATCSGNDDECGANSIKQGTAPYPIAQDVYECICN